MKRFSPGQKVVCINGGPWTDNDPGPKKDEIVTIWGYAETPFKSLYLDLQEYRRHVYREDHFEPLISDNIIEELLKESYETATI